MKKFRKIKTDRTVLELARTIASDIALKNPARIVTIDEVQSELDARGYNSNSLGNAAGVLFKKNFIHTGQTVKSNRNHGRRIIVWIKKSEQIPNYLPL